MDPVLKAAIPRLPKLPFDDVAGRRALIDSAVTAKQTYDASGVRVEWREIPAGRFSPGMKVQLFLPEEGHRPMPGLIDVHGGSFYAGTPEIDAFVNVRIAREVGAVVAAPKYRLAPEHPFPAAAEDCYRALQWLHEESGRLGVDASRIGILGDSAGGGIAAAATLFARQRRGPAIAFQALTQPALDDRLQTPSMRSGDDTVMFSRPAAAAAWRHYLGGGEGTAYSAPGRMEDLSGLPPAYVTANELDPLRDEAVDYARRLQACGVETELHVWPGAFHGFRIVQDAPLAKRAMAELMAALRAGLGGG